MIIGVFSGPPAPANRGSNPESARILGADATLVIAIAAVALYALIVGILILTGRVAPESAYWLLALPCLAPTAWYLYGFLRTDSRDIADRDTGLILSALGWFFAALTFFFKHLSNLAALRSGQVPGEAPDSPLAFLCAFLAVAGVIGGAVVSGRYWVNQNSG